ncbi:cuticle tanning hormone bursicon monomer [Danaus plexippus plexippus]|uniref:Bursicon n=1 Tax=Danaus plexippus plexippus TaxID=278856 RepID=A0A212ES77_DANPL|nr:cuticle tanning hormone bursicon monomer [Danaus plexippus plexippus]
MFVMRICFVSVFFLICYLGTKDVNGQEIQLPPGQECQMTPVIHVLQHPGCVPKPIPSYACIGKCTSYVQVSGSKIWQMERSCNCCQESGEREASVVLFCPKAKSEEKRFRKVSTKAPLECMCRPCGSVEESSVIPQEIAGYADEGLLQSHFRNSL